MTPEEELLGELRDEIGRGEVRVSAGADETFRRLGERFPVCGSQIDWRKVAGAVTAYSSDGAYDARCADIESFVATVLQSQRLAPDQQVSVVSDNAMQCALLMPLRTCVRRLRSIVALPQHTYVVGADATWCMVFTNGGYLAFGWAPRPDGVPAP